MSATRTVNRRRNGGRHRDRADDMLATALQLFAEKGFANVTIKHIARAADMNSALIYYYYKNKEDLFLAALRYAIGAALDSHGDVDLIERTSDPAAVIRFWFEKNRKLLKPIGQLLKLMLDYKTGRTRLASVQKLINRFYEAEMSLLARSIERGIRSGGFRPVDVKQTALFVSMHLDGLIVASTIRPETDPRASLDHFERILFEHLGFADGAAAPNLRGELTAATLN